MIEKQFEFYSDDDLIGVLDTVTGKTFNSFEIVDKLNEQQATITHLEKVNGKNFAKRRLLEQDNLVLRNENEQLRENLHNCRLNKNIISEKLKLWQDVHKEYDIYSIKEFKELMKKVK